MIIQFYFLDTPILLSPTDENGKLVVHGEPGKEVSFTIRVQSYPEVTEFKLRRSGRGSKTADVVKEAGTGSVDVYTGSFTITVETDEELKVVIKNGLFEKEVEVLPKPKGL